MTNNRSRCHCLFSSMAIKKDDSKSEIIFVDFSKPLVIPTNIVTLIYSRQPSSVNRQLTPATSFLWCLYTNESETIVSLAFLRN